MKEMTFLERLAESLLEGGFVRALKPRLQPVQIAKALTREMERSQVVGAGGPIVANSYLVHLHPDDLAVFSEFRGSLEREFAAYLRDYAGRHGLHTLISPTVRLLSSDPPPARGRIVVKASLVDPEPEPATPSREMARDWEGTVIMPTVQAPMELLPEQRAPAPPEQPPAFLVDDHGQRFGLDAVSTSIGRAVDNDIVLEVLGVSRHHARILWEPERYVLVDLGSTNGSFVAGKRVSRHPLSTGEQLSFGGASFTFQMAADHEG